MRVCFQGFSSEEAQEEYMQIVKGWAGFGATMFDVTVSAPHIFALHLTVCFAFSILFRHTGNFSNNSLSNVHGPFQ